MQSDDDNGTLSCGSTLPISSSTSTYDDDSSGSSSLQSSSSSSSSSSSLSRTDSILQADKPWEITVSYEDDSLAKQTMETIRQALSEHREEDNDEDEDDDDEKDDCSDHVPGESTMDECIVEQYAFYHESEGTPLFAAIEESKWKLALEIAKDSPQQVRTWVKSTGTIGTTFGWSLWQRLPIHEACRRQAPAWLISNLLSVFSASANKTTQFGELPLHLAVECGAAPEVVNLLIAANFSGVGATDQSGRTPLEILNETDLLESEDQKVVFESLTRSTMTYKAVMTAHAREIAQVKKEHAKELEAIMKQHDDDLKVEHEQQSLLDEEVLRLSEIVSDLTTLSSKQAILLEAFEEVEASWKERHLENEDKLKRSDSELRDTHSLIQAAREVISLKDMEIDGLNQRIGQLTNDLQAFQLVQSKTTPQLEATTLYLRQALSSFMQVCTQLDDQSVNLQKVLTERGIGALADGIKENDKEEKKVDCDEEESIDQPVKTTLSISLTDESIVAHACSVIYKEKVSEDDFAAVGPPITIQEEDDEVMYFIHALENDEEVPSDISGATVAAANAVGKLKLLVGDAVDRTSELERNSNNVNDNERKLHV